MLLAGLAVFGSALVRVRDERAARLQEALGADVVVGDLQDRASLPAALDDVTGVYTAREDQEAIGFVFAPGDTRWSMRPEPVPRVSKADKDTGQDPRVGWVGDRLMLAVGYTPDGAPYGCYADEMEDPF